jgi:tmRNA-binding protein
VGIRALSQRNHTSSDSYEYSLFHFLYSEDLERFAKRLPDGPLKEIRQGWVVLAWELGMILRGWMIDSVRNERRKKDLRKYKLKLSLREIELLRNAAGDGGLTLISDPFMSWAMKVMLAVAKELTPQDIEQKGEPALRKAKQAILNNADLKSRLALLVVKQKLTDSSRKSTPCGATRTASSRRC